MKLIAIKLLLFILFFSNVAFAGKSIDLDDYKCEINNDGVLRELDDLSINIKCKKTKSGNFKFAGIDILVSFDLTFMDWAVNNTIKITYNPKDDIDKNGKPDYKEIEHYLGNEFTKLAFDSYCGSRKSGGALGFQKINHKNISKIIAKLDRDDTNFDRCIDTDKNVILVDDAGTKTVKDSNRAIPQYKDNAGAASKGASTRNK